MFNVVQFLSAARKLAIENADIGDHSDNDIAQRALDRIGASNEYLSSDLIERAGYNYDRALFALGGVA